MDVPFHLEKEFAGSWEYAPPELLYGEVDSNNIIRRIGCDLYLLGSMVAFYFTNMTMTALIRSNLDEQLCWTQKRNDNRYPEIKPYLTIAFEKALEDINNSVKIEEIRDQVTLIVRYLCNPNPALRGHPKNIQQLGYNFRLNRFVTMFDRLVSIVKTKYTL